MAQEIKEDVFWIGMDDPESRDFHGIHSPRGGSYNSYLVIDEKSAIIDGTNKPFLEEYMRSLRSKIDPRKIAYIVINHAEPDHAGAIKELLEECKNAQIVCTQKCKEFVESAFGLNANFNIVDEGHELSLGKKKLVFYMDPMVHWPETMMTYLCDDKILFSGDLFATEISHESMFADEMESFGRMTRDYFAIIMRPFAIPVKKAIDKVKKLEIDFLAPSHGPTYRKDVNSIIETYEKLAVNPEEEKVLIVYYSIWHSTQKMANQIAQGIITEGYECVMYNLADSNLVEIMAQALTSKAIVIGSLTFQGSYHPSLDSLFPLLRLNNQKDKPAVVFGTYGWTPASVQKLKTKLEEINYKVLDSIEFRFGPKTEEDNSKLNEIGKKLVNTIKA